MLFSQFKHVCTLKDLKSLTKYPLEYLHTLQFITCMIINHFNDIIVGCGTFKVEIVTSVYLCFGGI